MKKTFFWLLPLLFLCNSASAFESRPPRMRHRPSRPAATVQLAFSPQDDAGALIVQAIHSARKQVLVQSFSFTHRKIAQTLIDAKARGVDVQLIADEKQIRRWSAAGAEYRRRGGAHFRG